VSRRHNKRTVRFGLRPDGIVNALLDHSILLGELYGYLEDQGHVTGKSWCQRLQMLELSELVGDDVLADRYRHDVTSWLSEMVTGFDAIGPTGADEVDDLIEQYRTTLTELVGR
jgi:hypothetical protein